MGTRIIVTPLIKYFIQLRMKYCMENLTCKLALYYFVIQLYETLSILASDKYNKATNFSYVRDEMMSAKGVFALYRLRNLLVHNSYKVDAVRESFAELLESSIIQEAV